MVNNCQSGFRLVLYIDTSCPGPLAGLDVDKQDTATHLDQSNIYSFTLSAHPTAAPPLPLFRAARRAHGHTQIISRDCSKYWLGLSQSIGFATSRKHSPMTRAAMLQLQNWFTHLQSPLPNLGCTQGERDIPGWHSSSAPNSLRNLQSIAYNKQIVQLDTCEAGHEPRHMVPLLFAFCAFWALRLGVDFNCRSGARITGLVLGQAKPRFIA